jgi:general secretion pathway protein K
MITNKRPTGSALVLVLWLVAAMSLVVLAGVRGIRSQSRSVGLELERIRSEAILDGALQLTAQRLMIGADKSPGYRWIHLQLEPDDVWVEVTPSSGLIDVNVAGDEVIQALLIHVGRLTQDEAAVMASRIHDWLDPDDEPSGVGGAEAAQYRAAGWPSVPRNAAMEDPSELLSVLGMTPDLYEIIRPFLGLNGQQRIEADAAPPELIDGLTGQEGFGAQLHAAAPEQRSALMMSQPASRFFSGGSGSSDREVRLRVFTGSKNGQWWLREAWVALSSRPDTLTPWTTLLLEPTRRVPKLDKEIRS